MVQTTSRLLGWFSAALGAVQLLAPGRFLGAIGIVPSGGSQLVARVVGLRELTVVPALLTVSRPFAWLFARVAGDVMDLGLLWRARRAPGARRATIATAMGAVAVVTVVDLATALAARRAAQRADRHAGRTVRTITINRSPAELYGFWRDLRNLPTVMPHLEAVEVGADDRRSHWTARGPMGSRVEWDAEIVDDRQDHLVAWRSVAGSDVANEGTVRFEPAPGDRGTEVSVEMAYDIPGGPVGSLVASLTGESPGQQVDDALRRFKQVMETGEPIRSPATANGRRLLQRPGQPLGSAPEPVGAGR